MQKQGKASYSLNDRIVLFNPSVVETGSSLFKFSKSFLFDTTIFSHNLLTVSELKGAAVHEPSLAKTRITDFGSRRILAFLLIPRPINLTKSLVEIESLSERKYVPGIKVSSIICSITKLKLSIDKKDRLFSKTPNGYGIPDFTNLYNRLRFF